MVARTTALWIVLLVGCASANANRNTLTSELSDSARTPGLYFGHSQGGALVIAASHYDAMTGLATTADELGAPLHKTGSGEMLCSREMLTGTHVPSWTCRYVEDMRETRQMTRDWLDRPAITIKQSRALPTIGAAPGAGGGNKGMIAP
ncbi:MAG TPA: hypothetical protein VE964_01425 [Myxococcales bacterium]|nr:hypothetical protein [Myxococcales bacterium]